MIDSGCSFLLRPTSGVSTDRDGRRLIGGSPLKIVTLTQSGAELVAGWFDGTPVGLEPAHQALARRLVESDLATPLAIEPAPHSDEVLVVIPVKDDPIGLATTLRTLGHTETAGSGADPGAEIRTARRIVIVDDGSDPVVGPTPGGDIAVPVTVVRRSVAAGPGNARNLGLRAATASTVVFVDAGVIVTADQLQALTAELSVGTTVAVAPRIRSESLPTPLARYERMWSPLDLGSEAGLVGPGRRISYVPSTCLGVRASALVDAGGFDPDLRFGEDVDLIWRLGRQGWVRYVPHIEVTHPPRSTVGGFIRQRYRYGSSAGPLALRHGRAVAPARLDRRTAVAWAALFTGFRRPAALIAGAVSGFHLGTLIRCGVPPRRAFSLVVTGWVATVRGLAMATARAWWPLAVIAATRPRYRPAAWLLLGGWLRRVGHRSTATADDGRVPLRAIVADTVTDLALGVLDDTAYALGVWRGSIRARTFRPLLPDLRSGRRPTER